MPADDVYSENRQGDDDEASDDSMPALEYVGASLQGAREGLRPGDEVVFEGLSRAELNGQKATVLPFTDAQMARKGRLGVRLESGPKMALKRENLRKVRTAELPGSTSGGASSSTAVPSVARKKEKHRREPSNCNIDRESEDSMPPLEYVGSQTGATSAPVSQMTASKVERQALHKDSDCESASSMPPLEYVGTTRPQPSAANADDASDDSMPPLDYVGSTPKEDVVPSHEDDDMDDMPPLEYAGGLSHQTPAPSPPVPSPKAGGQASDIRRNEEDEASDDSMPPLEFVGRSSQDELRPTDEVKRAEPSRSKACGAPSSMAVPNVPSKLDRKSSNDDKSESEESMPPLEYVGRQSGETLAATSQIATADTQDSSDESMPPLEYVGSTPKQEQGLDDASDDSMPPLDYVGPTPKREPEPVLDYASDDSMPPLEYVGPTPKQEQGLDDASDDSMPPLVYVGPTPKEEVVPSHENDDMDDMPPLEYVGRSVNSLAPVSCPEDSASAQDTSSKVCFEVGDTVLVKGLMKKELNGQTGVIESASVSVDSRLPVRVDSSKKVVLIKVQNLEKFEADDVLSDNSMPPLEHVGSHESSSPAVQTSSQTPNVLFGSQPQKDQSDSDESMPPLEYVGTQASSSPAAKNSSQIIKTGSDSEDSMPPLEFVGSSPTAAQTSTKDKAHVVANKLTPSPPQAAKQDAIFKVGDVVSLQGLSKQELNGQFGVITKALAFDGIRFPVKLRTSGKTVSIKGENLKIVANATDDTSDDSMPVLKNLGNEPSAISSSRHMEAESDDSMPPLDYVRASPKRDVDDDTTRSQCVRMAKHSNKLIEKAASGDESEDSMPPLDYVGSNTSQIKDQAGDRTWNEKGEREFKVGDAVILKGLSKHVFDQQLNGRTAFVLTKAGESHSTRITVKLDKSEQRLSVRKENLEHVVANDDASDDSMPSLDFVGPKSDVLESRMDSRGGAQGDPTHKATMAQLQSDERHLTQPNNQTGKVPIGVSGDSVESDDSMPPLDNVGSAERREPNVQKKESKVVPSTTKRSQALQKEAGPSAQGNESFRVGDTVVLRDLADTRLNGQRAIVMGNPSRTHGDRCAIRIVSTGQKLSVKFEKIEKLQLDSARPIAAGSANSSSAKTLLQEYQMLQSRGPRTEQTIVQPQPSPSMEQPSASLELEQKNGHEDRKKTGPLKPAQAKQITAETLLEKMREALSSNSERMIADVLIEVESAKELRWGDLLAKKKQIMKKLRAKKKKLEGDGVSGVESELPTAGEIDFAERNASKFKPTPSNTPLGPPPSDQSDGTDKNWVVLATESLQDWCTNLNLPSEVLQRLQSEEVTSPSELAYVPEEDLKDFVKDLKMGPKGRFLAAVQGLRKQR